MDPNVVWNNDVKRKDATRALVIAVSSHDIFDLGIVHSNSTTDSDPLPKGTAFPFIKAVQVVNEKLMAKDPHEALLFDVILIANDHKENQPRIFNSAKHYRLEIGRFCFCNKEDFVDRLRSNNVKLFLSTDSNDVCKALQTGVPAALLYPQTEHHALDQLKVLFSGDVIGFPEDAEHSLREQGFTETQLQTFKAAKNSIREFARLIGEMRRRFGCEGSPLCTSMITVWGSRDVSASALKTMRDWGLDVDEAFSLAGAPRSPILAHVQPHILCDDGLHNTMSVSTRS